MIQDFALPTGTFLFIRRSLGEGGLHRIPATGFRLSPFHRFDRLTRFHRLQIFRCFEHTNEIFKSGTARSSLL